MRFNKLIKMMGLATLLMSSSAMAEVTPIDFSNGVSSVTISAQHTSGSGDVTGSNYGYANGLEQFAYYININYAETVSADQINTDFAEGITLDVDVPTLDGIKHMHFKMPTSTTTCLNQGGYIYPGYSGDQTKLTGITYNGLINYDLERLPNKQGNNWHCSNDKATDCRLYIGPLNVLGNMENNNQARVCLTSIQNEFASGAESGSNLNSEHQVNQLSNSSKETRFIYIQAADFSQGSYVVGLTYTDNSGKTFVVNENSGAQNMNIMHKPQQQPSLCYKNSISYGTDHHEHPGLEFRDYYVVNSNSNSSLQYMPIGLDVDKRDVQNDGGGSNRTVWGYLDMPDFENVLYAYTTDIKQQSKQVVLNKVFTSDTDKASFLTRNFEHGGGGTGGSGHTIQDDKNYTPYTAKNISINSINPNQNYIELLFWGSWDSDDATDNDQSSMPQNATQALYMDQFGNAYYAKNKSLTISCS